MSNINLILEERAASIGQFMVGRLLPFRQKRAVGPFVFIDHMGPEKLPSGQGLDVPPHPHIGLSTLTYLFEGSMMHRDSIGSVQEITPGAVNWMTAGKGVVHSERTPEHLRNATHTLHGLQLWVALPKHLENMEPKFWHIEKNALTKWEENGTEFTLIAGEALGKKSPVPVHSELYFIKIKSAQAQTLDFGAELFGESALYILSGSITADGETFGEKQLLVAKENSLCSFTISAGTTLFVFGGEPFPEERFIHWNFVHSDKKAIEEAKEKWRQQQFPKINGETDFVPLPE